MKLRVVLVSLAALVLASPAMACLFDTWDFGANCDGYYANGTLRFGDLITEYVILNVTLSQAGSPVCTYAETVAVEPANPSFSFSGRWCTELCGDFVADATLEILSSYPDTKAFSVPFTCECDQGSCHFTPGFWKNHPRLWPVSTLTIGGRPFCRLELLFILHLPTRGDATIICAHQLIAAMLNVANGADDSIQGAIDRANHLLARFPIGSNPRGAARAAILCVKDELCAYNELILPGCSGRCASAADSSPRSAPAAPAQKKSWGAIKDIYR